PQFDDLIRRTNEGWKLDWWGLAHSELKRRQMEWEERSSRRRTALYKDLLNRVSDGRIGSATDASDAVQAAKAAEEPRPR
ncbi:MAG TPA: hypothetical protein VGB55_04230, partial [Tepidisphaeraceae bacterium]